MSTTHTFISPKVVADYDNFPESIAYGLYNSRNERVAIELHICIGNRLVLHPCIIRASIAYDVVLGSDFLMKFGFSFRLGNITINNHSPRFSTYDEIQYWRRVEVINGPQVQNQPARIIRLANATETTNEMPRLVRRTMNEDEEQEEKDEQEEQEDVLDLHPSSKDLNLLNAEV